MNSEIILETFEKRLLMQRYAGNTIRSYKDYASIFLKHVSKYPSLEEIPLSDIEAFINEKVQNGKISVSYQKGLVGAIKKMYELILDKKIQLDYLYPKRSFSKLPKFFSKEEVRNILDNTQNLKHKAILMTIYTCFRKIIQNRKKPKSEPVIDGKSSFLYLDKNDMPMVALHWEKYFQHICEKYNKIYKQELPKITPHVCRHTFCSNMAKSGMNPKTLQKIMGHSDIGVTLNTYTHLDFDDIQKEMKEVCNR